ncbi:MAG: alpha-glucosidase [Paracoccaceae bacterium]
MSDWWKGAVTYQVYPRSFQDSTGDGIGDLPGITSRLQYLADLGVDCLWLSPFFTSPMKDMGYDVADYCAVDPVFGTIADFDALVARAHDLGLRIIIDQVLSHSSDAHPFFGQSRASRTGEKADWYVWADPRPDGSPPNNWLSVFGGPAWTWDARRHQYYLHNFLISQPDFNYHNPDVQDWALKTLRFWLDRGVDGFRFDTVNYFFHDPKFLDNPPDLRPRKKPAANPYDMQDHRFDKNRPETLTWLERIRHLLDEYGAAAVGEVGDAQYAIALMGAYTAPDRLQQCYSFEMLGDDYSPAFFQARIKGFFDAAPKGWPMWAFSNHDVPRHAGRWASHAHSTDDLAKQACNLLLSLRGSVCLWQGEELGQTDTELAFEELTDPQGIAFWPAPMGRDGTRTPMVWDGSPSGGFTTGQPWLPVKPPQLARHVKGQIGLPESVLEQYRAMLTYRRNTPALRQGDIRFIDLPAPVLGFERATDGQNLLCLFNLSADPQDIPLTTPAHLTGPSLGLALSAGRVLMAPNAAGFLQLPPR